MLVWFSHPVVAGLQNYSVIVLQECVETFLEVSTFAKYWGEEIFLKYKTEHLTSVHTYSSRGSCYLWGVNSHFGDNIPKRLFLPTPKPPRNNQFAKSPHPKPTRHVGISGSTHTPGLSATVNTCIKQSGGQCKEHKKFCINLNGTNVLIPLSTA